MIQHEATVTLGNGPRVGDSLGEYRLTGLLGQGGMAKVFAAEHMSGGQSVAIKVLGRDRSASPSATRSFALEALVAQRITHPNVIDILASGEDAEHKYHVMERLDGSPLRDLMEDAYLLSVPRVLSIAREIASALAAAHDAGIVHRDLKPENVMVHEKDGHVAVKLIDFGAAKDLTQPTIAGETIVGTPIYMAPEQMWGQQTTAATDVYAFGLLVYEMLAGRLPFKARKFVELRDERSTEEPTPLRVSLVERLRSTRAGGPAPLLRETVPAELEALIMTCLGRSPDERPSSMREVCDRLAGFDRAGRASQTRTAVQPEVRMPPPTRTQRGLRQAVGYAAAVLAFFVSASSLMSDVHARGPRDGAMVIASR